MLLHENIISFLNVRNGFIWSINLVKSMIIDICNNHFVIGDRTCFIQSLTQIPHSAFLSYCDLKLLWTQCRVIVN